MKIIKYLSLILAVTLMASCETDTIEFDAEPIGNMAEFQLHYVVPVTATTANRITKVEINGQLYANIAAPLNTYNAIPSGSVGKFYIVSPGNVNIKMYQGNDMDVLVYDQNVTLTVGKQNVFVHDFNQPPVVLDNGYPYIRRQTVETDSMTWVRFYNFLYETDGVPTDLRLQYQYVSHRTDELVNIGNPVAFGECTDWQPVLLLKTSLVSSGSRRIYYKIKVVDNAGNILGDLQVMNSSGNFVNYSDYWTGYLNRRVHHIYCGMRAANPRAAVRLFYAL
ncbi:MAG: hypothetical protein P1P83_12945 [Bacteroidales bacterium]|nr:hypothetical protein [Bacteroidales bacterium]